MVEIASVILSQLIAEDALKQCMAKRITTGTSVKRIAWLYKYSAEMRRIKKYYQKMNREVDKNDV